MISDFISNNHWNLDKLNTLFGDNLDCFQSRLGRIDVSTLNHWVWVPKSQSNSISTTTYHFFNKCFNCNNDDWSGWKEIWRLGVAPRVKHFLQLMLQGRIATYDYLHAIKLGPRNLCILCGLTFESAKHLLAECPNAQLVYNLLGKKASNCFIFCNGLISSSWLTSSLYSLYYKYVIATAIWFIWKARCDIIFWQISLNPAIIVCKSLAHAMEFSFANSPQLGRRLLLNNFSNPDEPFLFIPSHWNPNNQVCNNSFFIIDSHYHISIAGCGHSSANSLIVTEIKALQLSIIVALNLHPTIHHLFFCDCDLYRLICSE